MRKHLIVFLFSLILISQVWTSHGLHKDRSKILNKKIAVAKQQPIQAPISQNQAHAMIDPFDKKS